MQHLEPLYIKFANGAWELTSGLGKCDPIFYRIPGQNLKWLR